MRKRRRERGREGGRESEGGGGGGGGEREREEEGEGEMIILLPIIVGIFDTVDCHTLFLPATKKVLLQDLSKVRALLSVLSKINHFLIILGKGGRSDPRVQGGERQTHRETDIWSRAKGKEWSVHSLEGRM